MMIQGFALDKELRNTVFISMALHLFYFSCIMFTFEDKMNYPMELPNIDFLGPILRNSDLIADSQVINKPFLLPQPDKFLVSQKQTLAVGQNYLLVTKPYLRPANFFVSEKLSTKLIGINAVGDFKDKIKTLDTSAIHSSPEWERDLRLKTDDKN